MATQKQGCARALAVFRAEDGGLAAALVIDGGGSNRMTIHGTLVTGRQTPSGERPIGDAIALHVLPCRGFREGTVGHC